MFNTNRQNATDNKNRTMSVCVSQREAIEVETYNIRISWLNTLWSARLDALKRQGLRAANQFDATLPETARKNQIVIRTWETLKAEFDTVSDMSADEFAAYYEGLVIANAAKVASFKQIVPSLKLAKKLLQ